MPQRICLILLFTVIVLSAVNSQNYTYKDLKGNFMPDLPDNWNIQPQQDPNLYVFQNGVKSIIVRIFD